MEEDDDEDDNEEEDCNEEEETEDEESCDDGVSELNIPVCLIHCYPTLSYCTHAIRFGNGKRMHCSKVFCNQCVSLRSNDVLNNPRLNRVKAYLCNRHFQKEMSRQQRCVNDLQIIPCDRVAGAARVSFPIFENVVVSPQCTPVPSSSSNSCITSEMSSTQSKWFVGKEYVNFIADNGLIPRLPSDPKTFRPGKTMVTFLPNILVLLAWKFVCGQFNLRWPKKNDLQNGSDNLLRSRTIVNEFKMECPDQFALFASWLNLSSFPEVHPENLCTWTHNIKRKVKIGVWSTAEEYGTLGGGLFKGHYNILRNMGFDLKTVD